MRTWPLNAKKLIYFVTIIKDKVKYLKQYKYHKWLNVGLAVRIAADLDVEL